MNRGMRVKRWCRACFFERIKRNHKAALCDTCATTLEQFFDRVYGYSPVKDAEALIGGTDARDEADAGEDSDS